MKERKSISSFKIVLYWFILLIVIGIFISFLPQLFITHMLSNYWNLSGVLSYAMCIIVGLITDTLLIIIVTKLVSKKYFTTRKISLLLMSAILLFGLLINFTNYFWIIQVIEATYASFLLQFLPVVTPYGLIWSFGITYILVVIPRMLFIPYVSKKLYVKEVVVSEDKPKYKIESEQPIYEKVDTTTNQNIDNIVNNTSEDVWNDNKTLSEKDILIVPKVEQTTNPTETPKISIKKQLEVVVPKEEVKDLKVFVIPFEGLIPGVNPNAVKEQPVVQNKPINEPIVYPSEQVERLCPNCGAKVSDSATTCFMCGKSL